MLTNTVQNYPARTSAEVRLGSRLSPRSPRISYVWDDLELPSTLVANLVRRAARVGYLGCADSPARLRVRTDPEGVDTPAWEVAPDGETNLPVSYDGFVADLDDLYRRFTGGEWVRRSWLPPVRAAYRSPAHRVMSSTQADLIMIWLRFDTSIAGRHALLVTEALRKATLRLFDEHIMQGSGELPPVLCGHGFATPEWEQAMFLVLPHVGSAYADGRIHGAAVALPPSAGDVVPDVRRALWHLRELRLPGGRTIGVSFHAGEPKPLAATPWRWTRSATRFVSALPVVHERFRKGGPTLEDATVWCRHAGLPSPISFRSERYPLLDGAPRLRPHEVHRDDRSRLPFSHIELRFADPVRGPVVIGQSRTFGLGLLAPLDSEARA